MRRTAIISDIHSNFPALTAVFAVIDNEGADRILCAGDLVGYNSMPNEVIELLRKRGVISIAGNHDIGAVTRDYSRMNALASKALQLNLSMITESNLSYLRSLKRSEFLDDIAIYHGSPSDTDEYIFEDMVDERLASQSGKHITVLGHTHIPYIRSVGSYVVVNPGSVGQPRDGDARASFLLLSGDRADIRRVPYDIEEIAERNSAAGIPLPLSERLRWGV
ncbi:MAG: YfcE family phosphodiesterase [Thermoplasmata archaeon]|uniref:Phosphoesterase n=1 Tax=Candidatus Sysuiplasma superficiale TaxID=2823368 RepID=A0A8J7YMZ7_9ARCH|nr:metallophosphoesterase family protein [Candidatus Sysuiplasma superficiale]MBX8643753.1 YfcE family phosphodiesterase [Candidatus Sysuiplasma superficiale]MCL4346797.1 metallophosphatase family protein [Candidatus Thermoplasmatota archaeon]MCL5437085.1 metallophosphatase family protein [Candidatus Thermoplasmatota archaeon]